MLSTDRWIKKKWYLHTVEYYSAVEKNEIMPFVTTKIDLEIVILKNKSGKDKYHVVLLIYGIYKSYK